jgi:ferredoxin
MRVHLDTTLCQNTGLCTGLAPQVFELDEDDGTLTVLTTEPADDLRDEVQDAADACPMGALSVSD